IGVILAGAATAARLLVYGPLGRELPFITYFPALIFAAALGGWAGGWSCLAAATVMAAVWVLPVGELAAWAVGSFWIAGALIVIVAAALSDSIRDLRLSRERLAETQGRLRTLVGELAHRNRNALFVIMSIVSQSARGAASADEAERIINARLDSMLRAQ